MRPYCIDMLKALYYCHKVVNVIHRDIKPDNIMINHNDEAVLIDFGVSALVDNNEDLYFDSNMGSYMYFSPEMFNISQEKVHGEKSDIWALGITFYYLLAGEYPWKGAKNPLALKELVLNQDIDFSIIKDALARDIISQILQKDPEKRASLYQLSKHPWVTQNGDV